MTEYIRNEYCRVFWLHGHRIEYIPTVAIKSVARDGDEEKATVYLEVYVPADSNESIEDFIDHVHLSYSIIDVKCSNCGRADDYFTGDLAMRLSGFKLVDKVVSDVTINDSLYSSVMSVEITMKCDAYWFRRLR